MNEREYNCFYINQESLKHNKWNECKFAREKSWNTRVFSFLINGMKQDMIPDSHLSNADSDVSFSPRGCLLWLLK